VGALPAVEGRVRADQGGRRARRQGARRLGEGEEGGWTLVFKQGKAPEQVLNFKFEEVREARLVPVVDFKGRKSKDATPAVEAPAADAAAAPAADGGEESR